MPQPNGLMARQVTPLSCALILALALPGATLAQSEEPVSTSEPRPVEVTQGEAATAAAGRPSRFAAADVPRGGRGQTVKDVIEGGPGYIAVGGGSDTGLDLEALIWVSDDGLRWQSVPLFGDAADGLIEAVAAIPGGGFVAVGRDFAPQDRPPDAPANALVWRSAEGIIWERIPADDTFLGAIMYDVATTADGVVAAGCRADFHCQPGHGRAWRSADGREWELLADAPLAPFAVEVLDDALVVGGTDDAMSLGGGQAVLGRTADGMSWGVTDPLSGPISQITDLTQHGDGLLAAGWSRPREDEQLAAAIFSTPDGVAWERTDDKAFQDVYANAVSSHGDLVLVFGVSLDPRKGTRPIALWSHEPDAYRKAGFPKDIDREGLDIAGGRLSDDGTLAFATGGESYRPMIWVSRIE